MVSNFLLIPSTGEGGSMVNPLLMQYLTLCAYTIFLGFCFCDGFNLPVSRKLACFIPFVLICAYVLMVKGQFVLELILPVPTILAFLLCANERRIQRRASGSK